jgi:ComEC/Rec2-related protein
MSRPLPWLRWLPLAVALAWLASQWLGGALRVDLAHLLAAGLAGAGWLLGRRLWVTALVVALLLAPLAWHFAIRLPAAREALAAAQAPLRVEGTVRGRSEPVAQAAGGRQGTVRLLLGEAVLWLDGRRFPLAELEVELPAPSAWAFPYRARLRLAGPLRAAPAGVRTVHRRLRVALARAEHAPRSPPIRPWSGEALRLHLRDRAAYYLSRPALAAYLPVVLGLRERDTPEARDVTAAFRRVGVAHLFAISGLHVGLLYLLFTGVQRWGAAVFRRGQGWVHGPAAGQAGVVLAVWLYIALLGFPIPAVRAALMGTLLVWSEHRGTRTPPLYVLGLTALVLLAGAPSQLYDVSFQLSFLAYFFLLCALGLYRPAAWPAGTTRLRRWSRSAARATQVSLWMTLLITLGLWPVLATTFGSLSLLVFAGNLILIPLLGYLVLPLGLAGLAVNLAFAGSAPGAWPERVVMAALDAGLRGWIWVVERLDAFSALLVFPARLHAAPGVIAAYYALLLAAIAWGLRRTPAREAPADGP